jgi:predicted signal transduction protein with EAL and GGDEF domain
VAYRDTVIGLPNRAALENYVQGLQHEPGQQPVFGVLCLDLDGFKPQAAAPPTTKAVPRNAAMLMWTMR